MSVVLNTLQELIAYHGTAHDFGEFDPAKPKILAFTLVLKTKPML
jgi:hypothetical protein